MKLYFISENRELFSCFFCDMVSLSLDPTDLELTKICLLSAEIKDVHPHTWPKTGS